jgi:PKD repeat protein
VVNQNGCSKTATNPGIVLNPCLNASFELRNSKVCQNNTISFLNTSFSSLPSNIWYWDFGDGSRSTFDINTNLVNHKFKAPGAYKVQLVVSAFVSGRRVTDTTYMIVNVSPSPKPDFTTGMVCNKQLATFTNTTSGSGAKIVGYNWTFGEPVSAPNDTTSVKDPTHMYQGPGSYEVMLTAKNDIGCSDSIRKIIVINGLPAANFKTTLSCAGQATVFTDLSTKAGTPISVWNWTFYDNMGIVGGKDLQNPDYVFKKPGEYMVQLRVVDAYGCRDSISKYISTWDVPVSKFTANENYNDEQGQLQFINESRDATRYHWTFGNGDDSYAEQPVYAYKDEGSYNINMIAYNEKGCSDTTGMKYDFMVKGLFIPNAFSPQNPIEAVRLLKPVGIHLQEYRFEVYDRWGNLLWWTDKLDSNGCPTEGWDGTYKDVPMPSGVYPWRATGVFMDGSIWQAENIGNSDHLPKYRVGTSTMMK